ncbi:hypothetical protein BN1708_004411 [Verticillium longisporum]|uniref:carnosine N-methyltransferase n=1 Tax=Verticillium longisporum TaxID=100787 RepID=A0A0G4LZR1_VERLO|nr:hypothetical protein BN1708_004411 [Verticillium longisporum]
MAAAEDGSWDQTGEMFEDPEEKKVVCCALDSYLQYAKVAHFNVTHLRRQSFYPLPQAQWQMLAAPPFNFLNTLDRTDEAIDANAQLARAIAHHGINPVFAAVESQRARLATTSSSSSSGNDSGANLSVLVPGAGLGRLVFELCRAGCDVEGNEISYHQLLASDFILNHTKTAGQFTIFPWVHTFSNHRTRENHLRSYAVPDLHPGTALASVSSLSSPPSQPGTMSMCAADFLCLYGDEARRATYDVVATVFFLDTAPNLVRYLETILSCLKPGGLLVNVGPLLWHFENNAPGNHGRDDDGDGEHDYNNSSGIADPGSFELADDEVMALVERVGFVVEARETDRPAPYIQDDESMMQTLYRASTWVARKPLAGDGI